MIVNYDHKTFIVQATGRQDTQPNDTQSNDYFVMLELYIGWHLFQLECRCAECQYTERCCVDSIYR